MVRMLTGAGEIPSDIQQSLALCRSYVGGQFHHGSFMGCGANAISVLARQHASTAAN
jgi:hypothetical protein